MSKKNMKLVLAPFGVAIGITLFITISVLLTRKLGVARLDKVLSFVPYWIIVLVGVVQLILWLPLFISGIYFLGRRGAVGQSESLKADGIYKYVRNPMYSGVSFTIFGIGLLLNQTGVALAGLLWLLLAYIQCKREEKELTEKFGNEYVDYKNKTSMLMPNLGMFIRDILQRKEK